MEDIILEVAEQETIELLLEGGGAAPSTDTNYNNLTNKPQINNVTLQGNKSLSDLGIAPQSTTYSKTEVDGLITGVTSTTYTKTQVDGFISTEQTARSTADTNLQDQINNLKAVGRFLSLWNSATGLAETNPTVNPYLYKTGDYFMVGTTGQTNYRPSGTQYVIGTASTVVETESVSVNDYYFFDGTNWKLLSNTQKTVTFANIAGQPSENLNLTAALNGKQDELVSGTNIKTINNNSLLGNSNIEVQDTLVSGTNIKTINNTSLLGSGNISIGGASILDIYPVGSIYMTTNSSFSPSTTFGGTWVLKGTRLTVDSRVYGNGKCIGLTNGDNYGGLMKYNSSAYCTGSEVYFNTTQNSLPTVSTQMPKGVYGVPTKAQITAKGTGYEDATGLTTDYITCYIYERTA